VVSRSNEQKLVLARFAAWNVGVQADKVELKLCQFHSYVALWKCFVLNPAYRPTQGIGHLLATLKVTKKSFTAVAKTAGLWPPLLQGITDDERFTGSIATAMQKVGVCFEVYEPPMLPTLQGDTKCRRS
jgi:hypothetical protein